MRPLSAIPSTHIPGMRIPNYRNSAPRTIRLCGIGEAAREVVSRIAQRGLPNVQIATGTAAADPTADAGAPPRRDADLIVIVCGTGDAHLFRPLERRPGVPLTFILLQHEGRPAPADPAELDEMRAQSDLFVTTSDRDYVSELIDNLAS